MAPFDERRTAESVPPQEGPTVDPVTGGSGSFASLTVVRCLSVVNVNLARWVVMGVGRWAAAGAGATGAWGLAV
ncbi:MAG: hypothetical protein ACKOCN_04020, partial [Planctomycetaceae bacterium]